MNNKLTDQGLYIEWRARKNSDNSRMIHRDFMKSSLRASSAKYLMLAEAITRTHARRHARYGTTESPQ